MKDVLADQWTALITNIGNGDYATCNTPVFPKGEIQGVGFHEAPRGALSHWVVIANGKIRNYQAVVPSTWVAGPRDTHWQRLLTSDVYRLWDLEVCRVSVLVLRCETYTRRACPVG